MNNKNLTRFRTGYNISGVPKTNQEVKPMEELNFIPMKDFCNGLREKAKSIADGEPLIIPLAMLAQRLHPEDAKKVTASYIRTILVRTPEIKEKGSVSIKKCVCPERGEYLEVTLNENKKRRIITTDDLPAIKEAAVSSAFAKFMNIQPDITDLEGDQLIGATVALRRMKDLIKSMTKG